MDSKYFTPEIGDIKVGHICETYQKFYKNSELEKEQWGLIKLIPNAVVSIIQNFENILNLVRVPYLTHEQIIEEGWESTHSHGVFTKGDYKLGTATPVGGNPMIWIELRDIYHFQGECKDINDLRLITKLLNIK